MSGVTQGVCACACIHSACVHVLGESPLWMCAPSSATRQQCLASSEPPGTSWAVEWDTVSLQHACHSCFAAACGKVWVASVLCGASHASRPSCQIPSPLSTLFLLQEPLQTARPVGWLALHV